MGVLSRKYDIPIYIKGKLGLWNYNIVHELRLHDEPFNKIKSGSKTIEMRLYDEKRQKIKVGDTIRFLKEPELEESFEVKVVDLLRYNKKANCKTVYRISEPKENKTEINKKKYYDYFGINKDNIVFLNYGRPGKTKGIFIYLEAIKKLAQKLDETALEKIKMIEEEFDQFETDQLQIIHEKEKEIIKLEGYYVANRFIDSGNADNFQCFHDFCVVWPFKVADSRNKQQLASLWSNSILLAYSTG